ncbi:ABC transporter ATP-binding protein [Sanguibacter sp. 25GB23B1]|uniref:ABC transporter ATP-binding protein n=1 Tax=unclassified Sanguibacter TaxID=2645534 RepID=UPI0032AE94BA
MPTPTIIRATDVSKQFSLHQDKSLKERVFNVRRRNEHVDSFWALKNIDLEITAGTTVGLVGANGSGKSTLLKVLGGIIQPTTGTVATRGRIAALLELGAGFHPDLSGRENIYLNASILGMSRAETDRQMDEIIAFSGIESFIDTQVKFYSSGMYVRLAFSVAIHVSPDLLLVDEVLAVGDEPFQRKCMDKIRSFQSEGGTILLVSHSADQIGELCDRAVLLRKGDMLYDGEPKLALRELRAGYEEDRVEETVDAEHPAGDPLARIEKVEILGSDGRAVEEIETGDDITVRIHVNPREPIPGWMAAVSIETHLGQSLFRFNTQTVDLDLGPLSSARTVEFRLPNVLLGEGRYFINVGIGDAAGATIDRLPQVATLVVQGRYVGTGVLGISPTIHLS